MLRCSNTGKIRGNTREICFIDLLIKVPHYGIPGPAVPVVLLHGVDGIGHKQLSIQPVLLAHVEVPGIDHARPAPQDLHHKLGCPHGEEEAGAAPPEAVSAKQVRVEASFPKDCLQASGKLVVVDEPALAVGEGWSVGGSLDSLQQQGHVPVQVKTWVIIARNRDAHILLSVLIGL